MLSDMNTEDVLALFGPPADLARALDTTTQNVSGWIASGTIPSARQYEIQVKSNGALVADNWDPQRDYLSAWGPQRVINQ